MDDDKYVNWKIEVSDILDTLVVKNFEKLYSSDRLEYNIIWGEISRELHTKYDLLDIAASDPEYLQKRKMQRYLSLSIDIYSEEEFPWELSSDVVCRFVKYFGKLPKQAPETWKEFEPKTALQDTKNQQDKLLDEYLQSTLAEHPEYTYR